MELHAELVATLGRTAPVHTVILYGSRARGDATPESDLDVAAFADVPRTLRDARRWRGLFLDAFIHPTARATEPPDESLLTLRGGRVLHDARGLAMPLLAALDALHDAGPAPLPDDERRMRRVWAHKTLARIARDDLEARLRRHQLLAQVLEDRHALANAWFPGPKSALATLAREFPLLHATLAAALASDAGIPALRALVLAVYGPLDPDDAG
jgi:hypothetical protein